MTWGFPYAASKTARGRHPQTRAQTCQRADPPHILLNRRGRNLLALLLSYEDAPAYILRDCGSGGLLDDPIHAHWPKANEAISLMLGLCTTSQIVRRAAVWAVANGLKTRSHRKFLGPATLILGDPDSDPGPDRDCDCSTPPPRRHEAEGRCPPRADPEVLDQIPPATNLRSSSNNTGAKPRFSFNHLWLASTTTAHWPFNHGKPDRGSAERVEAAMVRRKSCARCLHRQPLIWDRWGNVESL